MSQHNCPHPEQCAEEAIYLAMAAPHKKGWCSLHGPVVNDRPAPPTKMFKGDFVFPGDYFEHGSGLLLSKDGAAARAWPPELSLIQRLIKWWKS